jgi:hypothetical protein
MNIFGTRFVKLKLAHKCCRAWDPGKEGETTCGLGQRMNAQHRRRPSAMYTPTTKAIRCTSTNNGCDPSSPRASCHPPGRGLLGLLLTSTSATPVTSQHPLHSSNHGQEAGQEAAAGAGGSRAEAPAREEGRQGPRAEAGHTSACQGSPRAGHQEGRRQEGRQEVGVPRGCHGQTALYITTINFT